ncbi:MAG: DUF4832 domain-containing protein [Bacteriovoracaceae bacterium]
MKKRNIHSTKFPFLPEICLSLMLTACVPAEDTTTAKLAAGAAGLETTPTPTITPTLTPTATPTLTPTPSPTVTPSPSPTPSPTATPVQERITVVPAKSSEVLANPFKGYVYYLDGAPDTTTIPLTLVYDDVTWRQLEPTKGQFDWNSFEQGWSKQVSLGRKIGFRFKMADPWISPANDVPDWLISAGVPMRSYSIDGGSGKAPDWDNEILLTEHTRVLKALGARYNNDPRIAFVDVGSYGIWGEWHVWMNEKLAATNASKQRMLNDYLTNFPNKELVIAFDDSFATKYQTDRGHGIRNDCLGEKASNDWYLEFLNNISSTLNANLYKTGVVTGEFCGGSAGALAGLRDRFTLNHNFIKQTHWSFIGPAGGELASVTETTQKANSEILHKSLGYHFVMTEVSHEKSLRPGDDLKLVLKITNEGIAPFYYPWPVEISLKDLSGAIVISKIISNSAWDIRLLLPGTSTISTTLTIPNALPKQTYKLGFAIIDPNTNLPAVRLGNTGRDTNGRYFFSELKIE